MNDLLVIQQDHFDIDSFVALELVLQLVEQDRHVMYDCLEIDIDYVHRHTIEEISKSNKLLSEKYFSCSFSC
jgi:hypothetical protein